MTEYFDEVASSSSDEIVQRSAEREARIDYQYNAASVETKKGELYLYIGSLFAAPLAIALIYQVLFWIGRGFRRQPV